MQNSTCKYLHMFENDRCGKNGFCMTDFQQTYDISQLLLLYHNIFAVCILGREITMRYINPKQKSAKFLLYPGNITCCEQNIS